jgi:hypothetical protein
MKSLLLVLFAVVSVQAAEQAQPLVNETPFEPHRGAFFSKTNKFAHPRELIAPKFVIPAVGRAGLGAAMPAEVIVLVQTDANGYAKSLSVLSSDHPLFIPMAIQALRQARWDCSQETWFYYRAWYPALDE